MSTVPARPRRGQRPAASMDHVSTRLDAATTARLDALAPLIAPLGTKPSRSVAVRACILTGLDALEALHARAPR
jgi:hypothetical protein